MPPHPRTPTNAAPFDGQPRGPGRSPHRVFAWAAMLLAIASLVACHGNFFAPAPNLLAGRAIVRMEGVTRPAVLTDGIRATDGDPWDSELAAVFRNPSAFVEFDLGEPKLIAAAYAHGDNNDSYLFEGSLDGSTYAPFWTAPPVAGPGLQPRSSPDLEAHARFVRIRPQSGDRSFSLTETALYGEKPGVFPPRLVQRKGIPQPEAVRNAMVFLAFGLGAWVFVVWRGAPLVWVLLSLALPVFAAYGLTTELMEAWPVGQREVALVRGLAALVAAAAILRELVFPKTYPAHRPAVLGVLAIAAVTAFSGFFNLYHPQFQDQKQGTPLFVHNFDMRVYYPVAKYFPELRFDGLYRASVAAMVDDVEGLTLDSPRVNRAELRNLRTHRMERVSDVKAEIARIPERFTPERWEAFKVDMRYFRETMGERDYLGSMHDHGGNATPLWLALAYLIFMGSTASNETLALTGLLDPVLLILTFAAIWRAFGPRSMLVAVAVWGANDFYMFGSNWGGATLRHDWMAYLALGICALKTERFALGGALLALAAMIRAFPALSLAVLAIPAAWYVVDFRRANARLPRLRELYTAQRPLLFTAAGAVACVAFCLLSSSLLFSFDAWGEWLAKVRMLDRDPHVNHVSLRALVAGSGGLQPVILRARWPLFATGIALHVLAVAWASRGKSLAEAAVLGSLLIPIAFNPANYYIHFVYVVPLIALEVGRRQRPAGAPAINHFDGAIWGSLLMMCAAQYWTTLVKDTELHFQFATVLYFVGTLAVIGLVLWRDWESIALLGTPGVALAGGPSLALGANLEAATNVTVPDLPPPSKTHRLAAEDGDDAGDGEANDREPNPATDGEASTPSAEPEPDAGAKLPTPEATSAPGMEPEPDGRAEVPPALGVGGGDSPSVVANAPAEPSASSAPSEAGDEGARPTEPNDER